MKVLCNLETDKECSHEKVLVDIVAAHSQQKLMLVFEGKVLHIPLAAFNGVLREPK